MFVLKFKMYILLVTFTIAGIFSFTQSYAQLYGQALIDSLIDQVPRQKQDTAKVNVLLDISFNYRSIDQDKAISYARQALALAMNIKWKKGIGDANKILGVNYVDRSDWTRALECYYTAEKIFKEIGYKRGLATTYQNIGVVYSGKSDNKNALEYYAKAADIYNEIGYNRGVAMIHQNIAFIYKSQSEYSLALKYYLKAVKGYKDLGDKQSEASMLQNVGTAYESLGDYPKSLEHYFRAKTIFEETGDVKGVASIVQNTGNIFYYQLEYPQALDYYQQAFKIYDSIANKEGMAAAIGNIANVYKELKNYTMAMEYNAKALKMNEEMGDTLSVGRRVLQIASLYQVQKNYTMALLNGHKAKKIFEKIGDKQLYAYALRDIGILYLALVEDTAAANGGVNVNVEAEERAYLPDGSLPVGRVARLRLARDYLLQALDTGKKLESLHIMEYCYENLAKVYRLSGDYEHALECYEQFKIIEDSVFSKDNQKKIVQMQMQSDFDLKEKITRAEQDKKDAIQKNIRYSTFAGMIGLLGFSVLAYRQRNKVIKEKANVEKEKARSEELLLNILPAEVAEELKTTGGAKARHFDNVTVLFTDFVNFTQASEKMHPQALIDELHTCFKAFDEITAKYNIEKIKTIGDAYLAVAGLPEPNAKHASNVINAAIEMCRFIETRYARLGNETFQVRIGVHSGSVVAGIVGVRKFAYDVWGDTVNTAARMEQNSETGKVNMSEATYELVKDEFKCTFRGTIEAKNKGLLKMYFVTDGRG